MSKEFYPHGKLCISSVQKKEGGFEDYRYVAHLAATALGFDTVRNPENPGITQDKFELCLRNEYPVVVLLIGKVPSDTVNKEIKIAIEKCLPMFVFIKKENDAIPKESKEIIEKLSKVTYDYECATFTTCEDLYNQVYNGLKSYIIDKEGKRAILQKGVDLAYRANTELMKKSKRQIIIYQRTSILLLGPRKGVEYEIEFYKALTEWLAQKGGEDVRFVHVFNWEETVRERQEHWNWYNIKRAKENLYNLYNQYQFKGIDNLNIRYSHIANEIPYVITDTNLVFIIPIENNRFSIELPGELMRESEVRKILDEITRETTMLNADKIKEFYQ